MEELEMAKSPDGAEVETEDLDGVEAEDGEDWRVHKAAGSLMEDLEVTEDTHGAEVGAETSTNLKKKKKKRKSGPRGGRSRHQREHAPNT